MGHAEPRRHRRNQGLRGLLGRTRPSSRDAASRVSTVRARSPCRRQPACCDSGCPPRNSSARAGHDGEDDQRLAGNSWVEALRHQGSAALRESLRYVRCAHRRPYAAGAGYEAWRTRIFHLDGNYYALNLTEQLDVERLGGFLRIGLVHYNTLEEVERLLATLREIVGG